MSETALAPSVAEDSALPRFAIPADVRRWGVEHQVAARSHLRATVMLVETIALYAAFIAVGELVGTWWAWTIAWTGLVAVMMRLDAIHHEAVHRSLYRNRALNDVIAGVTGGLEGFHGPTYRCFHLAHHALTQQPGDPEDFYAELMTNPYRLGPITLPARAAYLIGLVTGGVLFAVQLMIDAISTLVGRPPAYVRTASLERHVRRWGWFPFALWIAMIAGSFVFGVADELLRWWVVPMLLFLAGPYTFFALPEHYGAERGAPMITSTGTVATNRVYRWITLDGNYHLSHHVFPTASWWWLAPADDLLRDRTELAYPGYLAFHAQVWRDTTRRAADPS